MLQMQSYGFLSILSIVTHLIFIIITWWALQSLRIDFFIKSGKTIQARLLLVLLTIAIGSAVSNFFLDYLQWSQNLRFLF